MEYNIIVDSSIWVSLLNKEDSAHPKALEFYNEVISSKIIPDFILQETATVLKNKVNIETALFFINLATNNKEAVITSFIEMQENFSKEFLKTENKELSYIDASLLAMHKSGKYKVLTLDKNLQKLCYNIAK